MRPAWTAIPYWRWRAPRACDRMGWPARRPGNNQAVWALGPRNDLRWGEQRVRFIFGVRSTGKPRTSCRGRYQHRRWAAPETPTIMPSRNLATVLQGRAHYRTVPWVHGSCTYRRSRHRWRFLDRPRVIENLLYRPVSLIAVRRTLDGASRTSLSVSYRRGATDTRLAVSARARWCQSDLG